MCRQEVLEVGRGWGVGASLGDAMQQLLRQHPEIPSLEALACKAVKWFPAEYYCPNSILLCWASKGN